MYNKFVDLLVEELQIDPADITMDAELSNDLGINSIELADLVMICEDKFDIELRDIRRPILSYDEETPVGDVWEEMLKGKEHIAQVRNEYGLFLGVVTMEDIIETIIGREIVDESDTIVDMQAYAREKWQKELKHKNKL